MNRRVLTGVAVALMVLAAACASDDSEVADAVAEANAATEQARSTAAQA